jgi:hypothetical protein
VALAIRLYTGTLSRSNKAKVFNSPVKRNGNMNMTGLDFQKLSSEKQKINYMKNSKYKREKGHLAQEPCGLKNRASSNF